MTIFSQICFSQQPVVPAEETVLCSALAEWVRPIWPHRPMPAPAQHRGILPLQRPCTELQLHSSVVFMLFIQKMEGLDASNLLPDGGVLFQ